MNPATREFDGYNHGMSEPDAILLAKRDRLLAVLGDLPGVAVAVADILP